MGRYGRWARRTGSRPVWAPRPPWKMCSVISLVTCWKSKGVSVMSAVPVAPRAVLVDRPPAPPMWRLLGSRVVTLCLAEWLKVRHDRAELYTRAIQPVLWLLIFGETFNRLRAIPTGNHPYLDYLAPGIMAQSALFI